MILKPRTWLLLCLAIIAIPLFGCLDALPIQLWDESRLANNSYEMYKAHHWIVSTYNWLPDMWNTKPPLLLWMQIISFKLFGVNELALRLPSAIAGAFTCLIIFGFFARLKKYEIGFISVLILITSTGFIKYHHSPRTGDYDALLTLFTTSYCLTYFLYIEEGKSSFLWLTTLLITLAAMTKCSEGLIFTPVLFFYTVYRKKIITVLKNPALYAGIAFFLFIISGYYLLHEHYTPGYIRLALENDWWGRFNTYNGSAGYSSHTLYYYQLLITEHFRYWYMLLFAGICLGLFSSDDYIKKITGYFGVLSLFYFLVITKSVNKSDWYDMPIYPLLSIIAATGISNICIILGNISVTPPLRKNILAAAFIIITCLPPYIDSFFNNLNSEPGKWLEYNTNICTYLKGIYHGGSAPDTGMTVVRKYYAANVDWYVKVMRDKKINYRIINLENIDPCEKVIVYEPDVKRRIASLYNYKIIDNLYDNTITIYQLDGKK